LPISHNKENMAPLEATQSPPPVSGRNTASSSKTSRRSKVQHRDQSILKGASIVRSSILSGWVVNSAPLVAASKKVDKNCVSTNVASNSACVLQNGLLCHSPMDPLRSTPSPSDILRTLVPIQSLEPKKEPQNSTTGEKDQEDSSETTSWYMETNTYHTPRHVTSKALVDEEKEDDSTSQELLSDELVKRWSTLASRRRKQGANQSNLSTLRQETLDWESLISADTLRTGSLFDGLDDTSEPVEEKRDACVPFDELTPTEEEWPDDEVTIVCDKR